MNFQRGIEPKECLGLGYMEVFKSMKSCLMGTEEDLYQNVNNQFYTIEGIQLQNIRKKSDLFYSSLLIIVVFKEKFKIIKNRFTNDNGIYPIEELPEMIFRLKKHYDIWMTERRHL